MTETSTRISYQDFLRTGPGTLGGRYMRTFWQPVALGADLAPGRAKPLRIMSEDFTVYRGEGGEPHMLANCTKIVAESPASAMLSPKR